MPTMANITVKKNDGTTDIVWTAVVQSAGDKSAAIWRSNSVGTAPNQRPNMRVTSSSNGPGTARRVEGNVQYPSVATGTDGKINVVDRGQFSFNVVLPQGMLDTDLNEFVSQACNLLASTLMKDTFKSGYAPT